MRELRTRLKMRQSDLAHEAGVTRQTIIAIEKDRLNPSVVVALQVARALREPLDYVFYLGPPVPVPEAPAFSATAAPADGPDETTEGTGEQPQAVWDFL